MISSNESQLGVSTKIQHQSNVFFAPGEVVDNAYRIDEFLAAGSMGQVYRCSHCYIEDSQLALKVVNLHNSSEEEASLSQQRFQQEVEISFQVDHPNVVKSYSLVEDKDFRALVMEYMPGGNLADSLSQQSCIPLQEVLKILSQACLGLQALHEAGVIHRDLKPENLLLDGEGNLKISDFGISQSKKNRALTPTGSLMGTMKYLSPEYLNEGSYDSRSDIYSLGLIGYTILTDDDPFAASTIINSLQKRMTSEIPLAHEIRTDCPEALSRVLCKATMPKPEDRYQNIAAMLDDINTLVEKLENTMSDSHWLRQENTSAEPLQGAPQWFEEEEEYAEIPAHSSDLCLTPRGWSGGVHPQTLPQQFAVLGAFITFWLLTFSQYLL